MSQSKLFYDFASKCEFCDKKFKVKGKCYISHIYKRNKNAAKSILSSYSCSYCNRYFIINGADKKHTEKFKSKFE